jgi:transcriptional regulator with XRE-family HTH domain
VNDITAALAERVAMLRKIRGLTQPQLAAASGLSVRTVQTVEQEQAPVRVKTVAALAKGLHVPTARLLTPGAADPGDPLAGDPWQDMRTALYQPLIASEPPSQADVLAGLALIRPDLAANRYDHVRAVLPALVADARSLGGTGRAAQSRVLNAASWLLTQSRQWEDALTAGRLALDAAPDPADKVAAANTLCWCLLRQGRLQEALDLAVKWADETEPRSLVRASDADLAGWGKLWLYVTNAKVRNNEPGAAEDALRNAAAAAARIGREVETDASTTRTFGPVTVPMIRAENAAISGKPDLVLKIAAQDVPRGGALVHAMSASVLRHRLDVAAAHAQKHQWAEAVDVLDSLRRQAPQWIAVQRTARDLAEEIVARRRTLTPQMREVAAAVRLDL